MHHLHDYHGGHDHRIKHTDDRHANGHANGIQITGKTRHQISGLVLIIKFHIHCLQMREHIIAQFLLDGTGCSKQKVSPQKPSDCQRQTQQKKNEQVMCNPCPINIAGFQSIGNVTCHLWNKNVRDVHDKQSNNPQNVL